MSLQSVKEYFSKWDKDKDIMISSSSSATVLEAAETLGVEPERIAKTLSFHKGEDAILVVTAGDAKIDNKKFKGTFLEKAKMLNPEAVLLKTGHAVGGVCPFGLREELEVYLDKSLERFNTVYPACGDSNSSIKMTLEELLFYSNAKGWVDVCKDWE